MAFFQVAAVDLDGTLTSRGCVSTKPLEAIDRARRNGLVVVLITGRIGVELATEFPHIADHFDALVLENGAVAVTDGRAHRPAAPVDRVLDDALAERGVPFRRGEVLLAVDGEHAATVVEVIGMLRLDCQIVRNRAAVMVLPAGVTKGTGLGTVLTEMNLSPHNTVAVGDAENDLSLFGTAQIGAAVANAVPSVREHADLVLDKEDGAGVAELLTGPHVSGVRRWCPPRWWVEIGTFDDGTPVKIPGSQARMLVTGPAGSGKSYLVGLMAEQWIQAGYCVLLLDPEGDHVELGEFNQVQVIDARHHLPEPAELVDTLHPHTSVVVDLSGLASPHKTDYLHRLWSAAGVHREARGFPHWVIYDEAHLLGSHEEAHWTRRGGYVLSSFAPASLPANEIDDTDVVLTLDEADTAGDGTSQTLRRASVRFGAGPPRAFTLANAGLRTCATATSTPTSRCPESGGSTSGQSTAKSSPRQALWAISAPRLGISIHEHSNTTWNAGTSPAGWMTRLPTRNWPRKWRRGRTSCRRIEPPTWNEYVASWSSRSSRGI